MAHANTPPNPLRELAAKYADAWNEHDLDAIMALHGEQTTYEMDGSSERYLGKPAVRALFGEVLQALPDVHFALKSLFTGEDHIVFEATITCTGTDGQTLCWNGIDLITVRDGQVIDKHSYAVLAR